MGNLNNPKESSMGPQLLLGNYTNVHYQSLIPLSNSKNNTQRKTRSSEREMKKENYSKQDDYVYVHEGEQITFLTLENEKLKCPLCKEAFQKIVNHLCSKKCNISKLNIDTTEFTTQLKSYREGFRVEVGRHRCQKSKDDARKRKQKSRDKLTAERGKEVMKEVNAKNIEKSR